MNRKAKRAVRKVLRDSEGRVVEDAIFPMYFTITSAHVRKALCKDPANCVIAQAVRAKYGFQIVGVLVGPSITKVFMKDKVLRFKTPAILARALKNFDRTELWDLPPGEYVLHVPKGGDRIGGRESRWVKHRKGTSGKGRTVFQGRNLPTRHITGLRYRKSS